MTKKRVVAACYLEDGPHSVESAYRATVYARSVLLEAIVELDKSASLYGDLSKDPNGHKKDKKDYRERALKQKAIIAALNAEIEAIDMVLDAYESAA